jgi:hypothetical protein
MTLPDERANAVEYTRVFLLSLLDPKKTPRVPKEVRQMARSCLRHYPGNYYMEVSKEKLPEIWGKKK